MGVRALVKSATAPVRGALRRRSLAPAARAQIAADRGSLPEDPGPEAAIMAGLDWLKTAQDRSASADGGVARHYSLTEGWAPTYPETTGYIVATILDQAKRRHDADLDERGRRMLAMLRRVQFAEGGLPGGMVGQEPQVPTTFNTGQILIGFAAGAARFGDAETVDAMTRAADFLATSLDPDGCWRSHPSPFAKADDKAYETHVSWGLFEAARVAEREDWGAAGLTQVRWALGHQRDNGFMDRCCLNDPGQPLTHTLGYALRGIVEAWRYCPDDDLLGGAERLADGLLGALRPDGFLPGRLRPDWSAAVSWSCLTGAVQIAHSWLLLYRATGKTEYLDAARRANGWVRRTMIMDGPPEVRGGVRGSYPVDNEYGRFQYLNWAAKFMIDACQEELDVTAA